MPLPPCVRSEESLRRRPTPRSPRESGPDGLYIGGVTAVGVSLLIGFTPRSFSNLPLTVALLGASLLLSNFKLRLPLWRGVSTMSMACAADLLALMILGPNMAMLTSSAGFCSSARSGSAARSRFIARRSALRRSPLRSKRPDSSGTLGGNGRPDARAARSNDTDVFRREHRAGGNRHRGLERSLAPSRMVWEFFWSAPSYFLSGAAAGIVGLIVIHEEYCLPSALVRFTCHARACDVASQNRRRAPACRGALTRGSNDADGARSCTAIRSCTGGGKRASCSTRAVRNGADDSRRGHDGRSRRLDPADERRGTAACGSRAGTARRTTDRGHARVSRLFGRGRDDALRLLQDGKAVRLVNDVAPDGGIPLVEVSGTPTRNAEGEVAGAVWVLRDITHIARAEQERAKAAHLESLGVLAGGLAHDFNNILTGVVGNLSLAQDLVRPEQQALRTRLEQAAAASARARGVTISC